MFSCMRQQDIPHMNCFFDKKPHPVVFGGIEEVSMDNEEDLEVDGIIFEDMVSG